ncbi:MAG TPA: hypothetical protein VMU75_09610 [Acidimicrobiales bacterium]|nr:hypothetical protein [Acidimicrobiales bacterium]
MARNADELGKGRSICFSRPLAELAPTSEWEQILSDDEPVELDVSVVELVRAIRDSGEA